MMRRPVLAVALLVGVIGVMGSSPVDAQSSAFTLRARADALGIEVVAREAPVVAIGGGQVTFLTPASAQAELDALGSSRAFASAPYPGELIVSLPSTLNGVGAGQFPPIPPYPFYAASSHPTSPEASEEVGPYGLRATSGADASEAQARLGISTTPPKVSSASGHAKVSGSTAGLYVSESSAEIAPFALAGVLTIGEVHSTARVSFDSNKPDAKPVKSSSLVVGRTTVAGVEVGITEKGLTVAGSAVPIDPSALTATLTAAGIQLEYVPGVETESSITSASLRITFMQNLPNAGDTIVRLVLGQVSATADPGGLLTDPATGPGPSGPASDVLGDAIGSSDPGQPGVAAVAPTAGRSASAPAAASRPAPKPLPLTDLWTFFVVLVIGAVAALGGARAPTLRPR